MAVLMQNLSYIRNRLRAALVKQLLSKPESRSLIYPAVATVEKYMVLGS